MFLNGYPYTDFHEMNADFLIKAIQELKKAFSEFTASNSLIFAEPLLHSVAEAYAKNTIVLDSDGNAYISLQIVPAGVQLSNTDYWMMVFNFEEYTEKANKNFTNNYFRDTTRAPYALAIGDWVVLDDVLYEVIAAISYDEEFMVGVNLVHFTIEQFVKDFVSSVTQTINDWHDDMVDTIDRYKDDIDASELAYQTAMQAEVDRILAGATVDSEVIDARLGADGVNYPTLGNAIRTQFSHVVNDVENISNNDCKFFGKAIPISWEQGGISSLGVDVDSATNIRTLPITVQENILRIIRNINRTFLIYEYNNGVFIQRTQLLAADLNFTLDATTTEVRFQANNTLLSDIKGKFEVVYDYNELQNIKNNIILSTGLCADDEVIITGFKFMNRGIDGVTGAHTGFSAARASTYDFTKLPEHSAVIIQNPLGLVCEIASYADDFTFMGLSDGTPEGAAYFKLFIKPSDNTSPLDCNELDQTVNVKLISLKSCYAGDWKFGSVVNGVFTESASPTTNVYTDYIFVPKGVDLNIKPKDVNVGWYRYTNNKVYIDYQSATSSDKVIHGDDRWYILYMNPLDMATLDATNIYYGGYAGLSYNVTQPEVIPFKLDCDPVKSIRISADSNLTAHVSNLIIGTHGKAYAAYYCDDVSTDEPDYNTEYLAVSEFYADDPYNHIVHKILENGDTVAGYTINQSLREPSGYFENNVLHLFVLTRVTKNGSNYSNYFHIEVDPDDWTLSNESEMTLDSGRFTGVTLGRIVKYNNIYYSSIGGYSAGYPATIISSSDLVNWTTVETYTDGLEDDDYVKEANICIFNDKIYIAYGVMKDVATEVYTPSAYFGVYDITTQTKTAGKAIPNGLPYRPMVYVDKQNLFAFCVKPKHYWVVVDDNGSKRTKYRSCMAVYVYNADDNSFNEVGSLLNANGIHYISPNNVAGQMYATFTADGRDITPSRARSGIYFMPMCIDTLYNPYTPFPL